MLQKPLKVEAKRTSTTTSYDLLCSKRSPPSSRRALGTWAISGTQVSPVPSKTSVSAPVPPPTLLPAGPRGQ